MVYYPRFPQNAIKIYDTTVVENLEDSRKFVTKQDRAEIEYAKANLPSNYWPSEYDRGPFMRDETWMQFINWKRCCEDDRAVEYVESAPTKRFFIPTEGIEGLEKVGGLKMGYTFGEFNFRDTGILVCKAHDLVKHMEDAMQSPEGAEFRAQYGELLGKAPMIEFVAIEKGSEGIYGISKLCGHRAVFFGDWDSYKRLEAWADREGVPVEKFIRRAVLEEYAHLLSGKGPSESEEIKVREWLLNVYSELAEKSVDAKTKEGYEQIVRHLQGDIAEVPETYREIYSRNLAEKAKMYISDKGKLEMILESEAIMEEGLTDKAKISEYVAERLAEIGDVIGEDSVDGEYVASAQDSYEGEAGEPTDGSEGEMAACSGGEAGGEGE